MSGIGFGWMWVAASLAAQGAEAEAPCPIVPTPKVYNDTGRVAELLGPEAAAILLGAKATDPERYAAQRLQALIERRFERRLPIRAEGKAAADVRQVLLLGQRSTNGWLDGLCREGRIDLGPASPGHDGFVIEVVEDTGPQVVLIGGSDPRGVIYGQGAFFDLLRRDGEKVSFPVVSVRDWPSIPWRGRPISRPEGQLVPGTLDAYVRSRLNWIDLRDGPPPRRGQFGIPPGFEINKPQAKQILAEAHRRGFFVYGTVFCGVKPKQFDAVLKKFEEVVELGVDGLWISFDDPGPGRDAPVLIERVLALAKGHGMTGGKIATVPPTGSYQHIETDFNRSAVTVPGFADATWLFTRVPCRGDVEAARRLGLRRLPAWWHNWPRTTGGFLHDDYGGGSLRAKGKRAYLDLPPLAVGWHSPRYERLRDAAKQTDTVMMWGGWPEEYVTGSLGIWAWEPQEHDWGRTRMAIYGYVFGPSQAEAARAFDDRLAELKKLFHLPVRRTRPKRGWPCRLKRLEERPSALKLLDEMDAVLKTLERGAPQETTIVPARLKDLYLEPMRATVAYARKMAELDYPEYWLGDLGERMVGLLSAGRTAAAERTLAEAREGATRQAAEVAEALRGLEGIEEYASLWKQRVAGLEHWKKLAAKRQAEMQKCFQKVALGDYDAMLAGIAQPPGGTAAAELRAADWMKNPLQWRGKWGIGLAEAKGNQAVAIAFPGKTRSTPGDYAEVEAAVPVPAFQGRLMLHAFVNDTMAQTRWTRYRFMQLWANDRVVWEEDIAASREGHEWITVDVAGIARGAKQLKLRFRVVDKRPVANYTTITFLGPIRLCAQEDAER